MTIKELKEKLQMLDESDLIYIEYECGNGKIHSEVKDVYWDMDTDSDNNGIISISGE